MHPDFVHTRKRYSLMYVTVFLTERFVHGRSRYAVCAKHEISPRTLRHWERGFCSNSVRKRLCFFRNDRDPPETDFASALCRYFVTIGEGQSELGAARAMCRLHDDFRCQLY
jgi:hypothetical protein